MNKKLSELFGTGEFPPLRGIHPDADSNNLKKYLFNEEISVDSIQQWTKDLVDQKVTPYFKSQEPPAVNDKAIKIVVGKTFDEMVMDTSKDVFVKYFVGGDEAKRLAPVWAKIAASAPEVVVTVFNTKVNEAENAVLKSKNFPVLVFYPKDNKKGVAYEGT